MAQHHIYFLISDQHFIPTGGIGSFFRGFLRMADQTAWRVSVILDLEPEGEGRELKEAHPSADYVWPNSPLSYVRHDELTRHGGDIINEAKAQNFVTSLKFKLASEPPDHILINTPDAVVAVNQLGLAAQFPTTYYTHHENLIAEKGKASRIFSEKFNAFLNTIPPMTGYTLATQSTYNLKRMSHHRCSRPPVVLPMPIPDMELLEPYSGLRRGVLFIGRHGREKDSDFFIKAVKAAGLPAKVLTQKSHVADFEKSFAQARLTDYEIKAQIIGQDKADFIRSARVAFHTSRLESYGFCALETLIAGLPTLVLKERNWWQAFKEHGILTTTRENAVDDLLAVYKQAPEPKRIKWHQRERNAFRRWQAYLKNSSIIQTQLDALDTFSKVA